MTAMGPGRTSRRGGGSADGPQLWKLAGMGFEFISQVVAGMLLGWLVDKALGSGPTWLVVGTIAGVLVAITQMIRTAVAANRKATRDSRYVRRIRTDEPERPEADPDAENRPKNLNEPGD